MGFAPAEVVAGVRELLATRGLEASCMQAGGRSVFRLAGASIMIGALPPERASSALFHPRTLLALRGAGPLAEALKAAIRLKFLRVTG